MSYVCMYIRQRESGIVLTSAEIFKLSIKDQTLIQVISEF
jgi:hypothetical protein